MIPPGVPVDIDVYLTMLAATEDAPGFQTTRDNVEFRFVWDQAGAATNLVWPGTILSSMRYGTGGSNATWCLKFSGMQAGSLLVPQVPSLFGAGNYWMGNFMPGGYIEVRVKVGSALHVAVGGAVLDFNVRERLTRDYGPLVTW
jgi:hypothetical protein